MIHMEGLDADLDQIQNTITVSQRRPLLLIDRTYIYIFRFRSYLVTDVGRMLNAKCGCMNFCEA